MTQAQKETMYWNSKHESHQNRIAITSEPMLGLAAIQSMRSGNRQRTVATGALSARSVARTQNYSLVRLK